MSRARIHAAAAFALLVALLATWSVGIARYGGPDEPAHVIRAASVARGELLGDIAAGFPGGYRVVDAPLVVASGDPACFRLDAALPASCAVASTQPGDVRVATSAGAYPPWFYALVGVPARWWGGTAAAHRVASLIWAAVLLALVWRRAAALGPAAVLLCAALVPAAWFLLAVVNPNGWELLLAALAWVGVARLWSAEPVDDSGGPVGAPVPLADVCWLSLPLAAAIAIRPVALMAAATVTVALSCHRGGRSVVRRAAYWAPLLAALASVLVWQAVARLAFDDPREAVTSGRWRVLGDSLRDVPHTAREMVASLGWLEYWAPTSALVLAVATCGSTVAWALRRGGRTDRHAIAAVAACVVVVPVVFETLFATRVGLIWQGRYSAPSAFGLIALATAVAARGRAPWRTLVVAVVAAVAAAEVLTFALVLHRYRYGLAADDTGWWPPIDRRPLLALHVALMSALATVAWRAARSHDDPPATATAAAPDQVM